jgi:MFS transporter, PHS family, inorganic phosphate transporter
MNVNTTAGGNSAFININNDYSHILDANERRRLALADIDNVTFGWQHVRAVVVAGVGFFTDAYDVSTDGVLEYRILLFRTKLTTS